MSDPNSHKSLSVSGDHLPHRSSRNPSRSRSKTRGGSTSNAEKTSFMYDPNRKQYVISSRRPRRRRSSGGRSKRRSRPRRAFRNYVHIILSIFSFPFPTVYSIVSSLREFLAFLLFILDFSASMLLYIVIVVVKFVARDVLLGSLDKFVTTVVAAYEGVCGKFGKVVGRKIVATVGGVLGLMFGIYVWDWIFRMIWESRCIE